MKYLIHLGYEVGTPYYYSGVHVADQTMKLSKAITFAAEAEATIVAEQIGDVWFANVIEVSDKELFEARLKGI